jgi:hypothetical protein
MVSKEETEDPQLSFSWHLFLSCADCYAKLNIFYHFNYS